MRLKQWLYGAMALTMMGACSDHDIASGNDDENRDPQFSNGISYLGISIMLPAEASTRTSDDGDQGNDQFDDGTSSEYNVQNAAVLLFKGSSESTAKFVGAYVMGSDEATDQPNKDNITTSFHRTIQVLNKPNFSSGEKLYGLAIVNYDDSHFKIASDIENEAKYGNLTLTQVDDGTAFEPARVKDGESSATTFEVFRNKITSCAFVNKRNDGSVKSIFMTNAPLSDKPGTNVQPTGCKITTLAELGTKFESTEFDAMTHPAGCIFVERAVAKVTCSSFPKTVTLQRTITDVNSSEILVQDVDLTIASVEWLIDNDEAKSYIVRNAKTEDAWWQYNSDNSAVATNKNRYRFVGNSNMADRLVDSENTEANYDENVDIHKNLYRTYWCQDPNYSGNNKPYEDRTDADRAGYVGYKAFGNNPTNSSIFASAAPLYPHENTFDIAHMNYKNTTRVVFKVKFSSTATLKAISDGAGGFVTGYESNVTKTNCQMYAIRGKLNTFYLEDDAQNLLKRAVLSNFELKELIKQYKKTSIASLPFDLNSFDITFAIQQTTDETNSIEKGNYVISSLRFKSDFLANLNVYKEDGTTVDNDVLAAVNDALDQIRIDANKTYHLVPFTDNTCYYAVNIQHFGDTYCKLPSEYTGSTTEGVYGVLNEDNSKLYLGRYGMVRNNWYDIIVDGIGNLGRAAVPEGNVETSDDNKTEEWYLSARIHVLSWAKRTQHETF